MGINKINRFNENLESSLSVDKLNDIIFNLHEYGSDIDKYCYGLPTSEEDLKTMREIILNIINSEKK
jgi:hypothetical protein